VAQFDPAVGKIKGPPCADCAMRDRCPGTWERYVQEYGWEEFTPVVHPSQRRGEILRVLTDSPCNNHCIHCADGPAAENRPAAVPLSRQLRDGILRGYRRIELAGGEFMLDGRFPKLVYEARDMGYEAVALETNARVLCVRRLLNRLIDLRPPEVIVRLNAGDAGVHDAMARVPGAFDQTMRGMRLLAEHAIPFSVRLRLHPQNSATVEKAREQAKQAGARGFEVIESDSIRH
jgi:MoaA/NifB/PqqE/SkfB family radical SAM enzyme